MINMIFQDKILHRLDKIDAKLDKIQSQLSSNKSEYHRKLAEQLTKSLSSIKSHGKSNWRAFWSGPILQTSDGYGNFCNIDTRNGKISTHLGSAKCYLGSRKDKNVFIHNPTNMTDLSQIKVICHKFYINHLR